MGLALVVIAAALGVFLVVADVGEDDADESPAALPEPTETDDGWTVSPVGWTPGATALSDDAGTIVATDTDAQVLYVVEEPGATPPVVSDAVPLSSVARLERAEPSPDGATSWVGEGSELVELDAEGEVLDTVALEHPGSVVAVTDDAVWLTVSGVPVADESGVVAPRSVVQRVDTETREVIAVPVDDPVDFHLAVGDDGVWAAVGTAFLQLDPVTVEPLAAIDLGWPVRALVLDGEGVVAVVADPDRPAVYQIDGATAEIVGIAELDPGAVGEAALVPTGGRDELWVLRPDDDRVDRVALDDGGTSTIEVTEPRRIEVTDDGVWLLGGLDDGVLLVARR